MFLLQPIFAGMPAITLTDYGIERFIGISTALFVVLVVVAIPVKHCWNLTLSEYGVKPLSYRKAVGVTFLGGMLFLLILVMIAGSRELFSPGAWVPDGILSKTVYSELKEKANPANVDPDLVQLRRIAIMKLGDALRKYAKEHDGKLPESAEQSDFQPLWDIPFAAGIRYEYFPSETSADKPLLREPDLLHDAIFSLNRQFELVEEEP